MNLIGYAAIVVIAGLAAWGGFERFEVQQLERKNAEQERVIQAHEEAGKAWESVYRQQEKEGQRDIDDTTQWWQEEKARADGLARDMARRLRDAPSGAAVGGGVPPGGDPGRALAACERRLVEAAGALGSVFEAVEGVTAAGAQRGARAEALARDLGAAPCVRAK